MAWQLPLFPDVKSYQQLQPDAALSPPSAQRFLCSSLTWFENIVPHHAPQTRQGFFKFLPSKPVIPLLTAGKVENL